VRPKFRYATIPKVKARVVPTALTDPTPAITDADILEQIEAVSATLNRWTQQFFQPVPELVRVSGQGDQVLTHPEVVPILSLMKLSAIIARGYGEYRGSERIIPHSNDYPEILYEGGVYPPQYGGIGITDVSGSGLIGWERGKRHVRMLSRRGGFVRGYANIEMTGWWGWLEGYKAVSMELATAIAASTAATTLHVDRVLDVDSGDFLEVGDTVALYVAEVPGALIPSAVEFAIVQAIAENGGGGYDLTVDPMSKFPFVIPAGTTVLSLGAVPRGMVEVAEYLTTKFVLNLSAERLGSSSGAASASGILLGESVDNYSYTLGNGTTNGGTSRGALGTLTGSPRHDALLREFVKPSVSVLWL
jgi:hypothetical protein